MLGGLTALGEDHFTGTEVSRPTIVMPIGSKPPPYGDVTTHWSKWLGDEDVHPLREPPRTRPQRSLVDAASWAVSDAQGRLIIIAGIQQGMSTTPMLREALTRRGHCKRRSIIIESILDAAGGIQSLPERDFREIVGAFTCRNLRDRNRHGARTVVTTSMSTGRIYVSAWRYTACLTSPSNSGTPIWNARTKS